MNKQQQQQLRQYKNKAEELRTSFSTQDGSTQQKQHTVSIIYIIKNGLINMNFIMTFSFHEISEKKKKKNKKKKNNKILNLSLHLYLSYFLYR